MSGPPVTGSVALVEDEYTLVINRGADAGVTPGMIFVVLAETSRRITDPESGRELGRLPEEKLRVKVFDVHSLFARAETFCGEGQQVRASDEAVTVNVGDEVELVDSVGPGWEQRRELTVGLGIPPSFPVSERHRAS